MQHFISQILRFEKHGEKTGWTYIEVPRDVTQALSPGSKKSFRVKGYLDNFAIKGVALLPIGEGIFIIPLNGVMRRGIRKAEGASLSVEIELDLDYRVEVPEELQEYMDEDADAAKFFESLPKSHRDYFIKWIEGAKTAETRNRRLLDTANALSSRMGYSEMMRAKKKIKD